MSSPASARPKGAPFSATSSGRCSLPPSQASPSSSAVTATGEQPDDGFDWKKPKPLASSPGTRLRRSEEHTSELQSLMRISYAVLCLKKKPNHTKHDSSCTHTLNINTTQHRS